MRSLWRQENLDNTTRSGEERKILHKKEEKFSELDFSSKSELALDKNGSSLKRSGPEMCVQFTLHLDLLPACNLEFPKCKCSVCFQFYYCVVLQRIESCRK